MYRCAFVSGGTTLEDIRTTNVWQLEKSVTSFEKLLVGSTYRPTQGA